MSNVGLNSSLLAQNGQDLSPAEQLMADLKQLAQDARSGNLPAVQQDYVTLSRDLAGTESSASAAEAGVIVSLLSDLPSLPLGPAEDPRQFTPLAAGFDYGAFLFDRSRTPQNAAASLGSAVTGTTPSQDGQSTPQPIPFNAASLAGTVVSSEIAHAIARPAEAGDIAIDNSAATQRANPLGLSIPDQESQIAGAASAGLFSNGVNPLVPGPNPDSSVVLPWTLFDWQYRSQPIPPEFLRKRKNPRGNTARTRSKRQKP